MSEIKPALTPEQWATVTEFPQYRSENVEQLVFEDNLDGAGALALLGYFAWDDVDALRYAFSFKRSANEATHLRKMARARSLADRLAALLPPREP